MPVDDGLHTRIQRNTQILQEARYNLPTWRPRSGHTSAHLQRAARLSCYRTSSHGHKARGAVRSRKEWRTCLI